MLLLSHNQSRSVALTDINETLDEVATRSDVYKVRLYSDNNGHYQIKLIAERLPSTVTEYIHKNWISVRSITASRHHDNAVKFTFEVIGIQGDPHEGTDHGPQLGSGLNKSMSTTTNNSGTNTPDTGSTDRTERSLQRDQRRRELSEFARLDHKDDT